MLKLDRFIMSSSEIKFRQKGNKEIPDLRKEKPPITKIKCVSKKKAARLSHEDLLAKATGFGKHRIYIRFVVLFSVMVVVYFYTKDSKDVKLALYKETLTLREQKIQCSPSYLADISSYPNCVPKKCGRFVSDTLVRPSDLAKLLELAKNGFELSQSDGGASIFDLHSGAISHGQKFVNLYLMKDAVGFYKKEHLIAYKLVKSTIQIAIAERFKISADSIYLTSPTFFSKLTNDSAKTIHDEYWHNHIDKETYEAFHYTSLLYLNNYGVDFQGGRFLFVEGSNKNETFTSIEPKAGRVSVFTSGAENVHRVERVTSGVRYAITISFTCNQKLAIDDPKMEG